MPTLQFSTRRIGVEPNTFLTAEGLDRMLTNTPRMPALLNRTQRLKLGEAARQEYNDARRAWLKGGLTCVTRQIVQANNDLEGVFDRNSAAAHADREGLMFSGQPHAGKSTVLKSLMRRVQHDWQQSFPFYDHEEHVPIVYLVVSTAWTPKMLPAAFCRFFGMRVEREETADDLFHRVMKMMNKVETQMVVIDEVHRLGSKSTKPAQPMDMLKSMHDHCPATFVYAGVDLETNALLGSQAGAQVSERFPTTTLTRFNLSNPEHAADWRGIIDQFEKKLPLADQESGSLVELAGYLHDRTGGSLGSLAKLITGAAMDVLRDPDRKKELLAKDDLARFRLSASADGHYEETLKRATKSTRGKAA